MPTQHFLLEKIRQQIDTAKYILERTYPLVQEEKLFVEVLRYLFAAASDLLHYASVDLFQKGYISIVPQNSSQKVTLLSQHSKNLQLSVNIVDIYTRLGKLTQDYKSALISFKRYKTYVICTKDYKVEVLSENSLKDYIRKVEDLYIHFNQIRRVVR